MRFAVVAAALEQLEGVTARHILIRQLASLFGQAGRREIRPLVYLLQGQLRPAYEGVEAGLGEHVLMATIAQTWRSTPGALARRLTRLGDLGSVAASVAPPAGGGTITLLEVYRTLLAVAGTSGQGARSAKMDRLIALLRRADRREAQYLVRFCQGRLRLGIGEQTVLEAAALAALGDRRCKPELEAAYGVCADLGLVVELAFSKGRRGLARIAPRPGIPVRPALAQRMSTAEAIVARLGRVQVEPKYDGLRLQLHRDGKRVWIFSRRLEDLSPMFPELARAARRQLRSRRVILEGEAIAFDAATGDFLPFQLTITRKRKSGVAEASARSPLRLFAFDLLYLGGRSCLGWPQSRRSRALGSVIRDVPGGLLAPTELVVTTSASRVQAGFEEMVQRGLEGIVAKRVDAPYHAGARGFDWVKLKRAYQSKLRDTVDLVLLGYQQGRGQRAKLGIGSLLAGVYDPAKDRFRTVARIGSGLTEAGWKQLRTRLDRDRVAQRPRNVDALIEPDVWVTPRIVVEVLADEITRSPAHTCGKEGQNPGYALRFPRLLRERADRGITEATTEKEILRLHRLSRRPTARMRGSP